MGFTCIIPNGREPALLMILGHGLCSSGLFFLVGNFFYSLRSRSLIVASALISLAPSIAAWFFLFCASNISCPTSISLLSELHMFGLLGAYAPPTGLFLALLSLSSGIFCLQFYATLSQNMTSTVTKATPIMSFLLFGHLAPLHTAILASW